jgi:hypothetical protein
MTLPIETTVLSPNALMVPGITVYTRIVEGKLVTAAHIVLQAAYLDPITGDWTAIGAERTTQIDNVEQLPEDLADATVIITGEEVRIQQLVDQAMFNVITLVGALNSIRKVL